LVAVKHLLWFYIETYRKYIETHLTSRFVPYSPVNEYLFACNHESADKPVPLCQLSMYVFFFSSGSLQMSKGTGTDWP